MCDFWVFNTVQLKRTYNPLILYYLQISMEDERLDGANANLFTCKITVCLLTPNGPQWHPYKLRWAIKWCRCQFVLIVKYRFVFLPKWTTIILFYEYIVGHHSKFFVTVECTKIWSTDPMTLKLKRMTPKILVCIHQFGSEFHNNDGKIIG